MCIYPHTYVCKRERGMCVYIYMYIEIGIDIDIEIEGETEREREGHRERERERENRCLPYTKGSKQVQSVWQVFFSY